MKYFEWLVSQDIKSSLPPTFDPHQFAYRSNSSTNDGDVTTPQIAQNHINQRGSYEDINLQMRRLFGSSSSFWGELK